jgi:hypothetical protein
MKYSVIRYQTKPEATQTNTELVQNVFRDLATLAPEGVRYAALRTGNGTFIHIVAYQNDNDDDVINTLPAFAAFRDGGAERRVAPPERSDEVTIVGNYRMIAE